MIAEPATPLARLAARGAPDDVIDRSAAEGMLAEALAAVPGPLRRVLLIPPDFTRFHSGAGELTTFVVNHLRGSRVDVLPALGTHAPMTRRQIERMFGGLDPERILVHDWRRGLARLGEVQAEVVTQLSRGAVGYPIEVAVNRLLIEGEYDLILSLGQVVPHEVIGMANQNKNVLVGTGGKDIIDKSHFLGAAYGIERTLGRTDTPVRRVFDYACRHYLADLPICYAMTVREPTEAAGMVTRGLFIGASQETYREAAGLSRQVNVVTVDEPLTTCVVWLDPEEFHSTWLGNKAIYRTRLAMADGGRLIVLAPGVATCGEDAGIDGLIRRHGYRGTAATLAAIADDAELAASLSAAAHLIHGSSEGRFEVGYAPGRLAREAIEGVGYGWLDLDEALRTWRPETLRDGWNEVDGERVFFVRNPALGLWARPGSLE